MTKLTCQMIVHVPSQDLDIYKLCIRFIPFGEVGRCGAGTAYPSGAPPVFSAVRVVRALVLCLVFCRTLFALLFFFLLAIVLSDLRILITPLVPSNASICHLLIHRSTYCVNS